MLDGHCVAITQAPPGRRLDRMRPERLDAIRTVRPPRRPGRPRRPAPRASSSAALAHLLRGLQPRTGRTLEPILTRAIDGAYLSAGQFARALAPIESKRHRNRALAVVLRR